MRRKTKTLLVGVLSEAIINSNTDRFDFASVLIEKYFTDPKPIAISQISYFYFIVRHSNEK
ncbi:MAG: hypothetical protein BWZ03_00375 [bacterium ADurb.BinA186]|nr:MAG: hypothetical protein BWZ03_00375 [bacterium ADurb.BinA186]